MIRNGKWQNPVITFWFSILAGIGIFFIAMVIVWSLLTQAERAANLREQQLQDQHQLLMEIACILSVPIEDRSNEKVVQQCVRQGGP